MDKNTPKTIADKTEQYPIGTKVKKKLGKEINQGETKRYDKERKYYWIDYNNEDSEEITHKMVKRYKYNNIDPDQIKRCRRNFLRQNEANLVFKKSVFGPKNRTVQ